MFFGKFGWIEIVLIIAIILLVIGPGKLPGLSRALGQTIRGYKDAVSGKDINKEEAKE